MVLNMYLNHICRSKAKQLLLTDLELHKGILPINNTRGARWLLHAIGECATLDSIHISEYAITHIAFPIFNS